ncbi:uncharacterized protein SCHCODRAFT_02502370, partial [Schizophyllum commune H4-8]|uniref:uncharacterized protein n=1 Tax=Schizophyllum commune (strain H4-8 / FGSC 9210) TaxID=578458 RepID=UPI00215F310F
FTDVDVDRDDAEMKPKSSLTICRPARYYTRKSTRPCSLTMRQHDFRGEVDVRIVPMPFAGMLPGPYDVSSRIQMRGDYRQSRRGYPLTLILDFQLIQRV